MVCLTVGSDGRKLAGWAQTPFYFVSWLVSVVLFGIDLVIAREVVSDILTAIGVAKAAASPETWSYDRLTYLWTAEFVNNATLLVLACVGIALTIAIEYYFRKGKEQGLLVKRVTRVFSIELIVGVVGWIITVIFGLIVSPAP